MKRASSQIRQMAERLMAFEMERVSSSAAGSAAMFPVVDKLHPHLTNLMGHGGVRALIARSLVLASAETLWLRAARVNEDGLIEGLETIAVELEPTAFFEGRMVLSAHLIGLLAALIGPSLTTRLISEVWPQLPLNERDFGKEDDHEKAS